MQLTDIPLPPQSAALGLHTVAHELLFISYPAKDKRLSWPEHTVGANDPSEIWTAAWKLWVEYSTTRPTVPLYSVECMYLCVCCNRQICIITQVLFCLRWSTRCRCHIEWSAILHCWHISQMHWVLLVERFASLVLEFVSDVVSSNSDHCVFMMM